MSCSTLFRPLLEARSHFRETHKRLGKECTDRLELGRMGLVASSTMRSGRQELEVRGLLTVSSQVLDSDERFSDRFM